MPEQAVGSLDAALARAVALLRTNAALAERQAREILAVVPTDPRAMLILGMALRRCGDAAAAKVVLEPLAGAQPGSAQTHHELGMSLASLGEGEAAISWLRRAVSIRRDIPEAWRAIGDLLSVQGDNAGADRAYAEQIRASVTDPTVLAAADALCDDRLAVAERLLRDHLKANPTDVAAMRLLAETGTRLGRFADAENLLTRCLELAPSFTGARYNLAIVLYRQQRAQDALGHLERLLADDPTEPAYRNLRAACLGLVGDYDAAIEIYRALLVERPAQPRIWLSFGHALRTAGRLDEAIAAYDRCVEMAPGMGEVYWSFANLKTVPFTAQRESAMREQLARGDLADDDRLHLHYALGKALEDRGDYARSFEHYAEGARLRRAAMPYDADAAHDAMLRARELFTADFFAARAGAGSPAPDPIFIVGLPRSGSTLIEQILASHSAVEGTMELPDITTLARGLGKSGSKTAEGRYPNLLGELERPALAALGEAYLAGARVHRKLGRPFFIDKMPNNFHHIGLIQLILPNARVIDARRGAMAACFSAFKQHFARGQGFSYDLNDLGRYYRDYVEVMDHYDSVLPDRIHRVHYEELVDNTEWEIRRLLDYCGLAFETACLNFYQNDRAVRTASSEQVRRPIFREGLDQWRKFEPWLGPLKEALGPDLTS
jgi:tetratricopeptide (TPR) repeat protein